MLIGFYDQIPHFIEQENSLMSGYSTDSLVQKKPTSEYYIERSKKKEEAITEMKKRIIQYTYKV